MSSTPSGRPGDSFSFKQVWSTDLLSGFQVFLIALPLCIGIALASGFPPMGGIIAAIIGGVIVSRLSGSQVTINGPAAGLIVVILDGVERLGHGDAALGYKLTLAAIVCAGAIQMLFGALRLGRLATFFPIAAVHGMLAGIGIIIMVKQFPVMLGVTPAKASILGMAAAIPTYIRQAEPLIAGLGLTALAIVIVHPFFKWKALKALPAAILVVVITAVAGQFLALDAKFLVPLPTPVFSGLAFPDFSRVMTLDFFTVVLTISIIASVESLLSAAAVDKLDKFSRKSDLNKDLTAIGLGTCLSGLLGGLPMIAEIVRSSANVNAGAKSGWSNFFHGIFLLVAVLVFPSVLQKIPLAALAALLVFTGFRLASPRELLKTKRVGYDQLIVFLTTAIMVLATDLLVGIVAGVVVKILLHLMRRVPLRYMVQCRFQIQQQEDGTHFVKVKSPLVFSNLMPLLGAVERLPRTSKVTVDLTDAPFIDHTALDVLTSLGRSYAHAGGRLDIASGRHEPYSRHPLAARRLTSSHISSEI